MKKSTSSVLKQSRLLARNTIINLLGQGIPLIFAAVAIPFVIDGLGTERFGVLTIIWVVIGYFGLFDMGIGRATTKFVADLEAEGDQPLSPFIFTSVLLLFVIGIFGSLLICFSTPIVVNRLLNIPPVLVDEIGGAFRVLSISIPFVLGTVGARGALEARQRFTTVNAIKIPASIINYVSPLLVLPFTNNLQMVVTILVVARICTFFVYFYFSLDDGHFLSLAYFPIIKWMKNLLSFGAWIMVSNFISPLMEYMDRFIIGGILTMSAVAYYTTPFEIIIRFMIISSSFMGVMFPAFSVHSLSDSKELERLYRKSIRLLVAVMIPLIVFIIISAHSLLYLWLGNEFAVHSTPVLRILALGIFVNSIAFVPATTLQAVGRPDITAKLHMIELPIYLGLIWYLTHAMGIKGAALSWLVRVSLDGALLLYFSNRYLRFFNSIGKQMIIKLCVALALIIIGFMLFWWIDSIIINLAYAFICALAALCLTWNFVLGNEERTKMKSLLFQFQSSLTRRV